MFVPRSAEKRKEADDTHDHENEARGNEKNAFSRLHSPQGHALYYILQGVARRNQGHGIPIHDARLVHGLLPPISALEDRLIRAELFMIGNLEWFSRLHCIGFPSNYNDYVILRGKLNQ